MQLRRWPALVVFAAGLACFAPATPAAQSPASSPAFEAASVKRSKAHDVGIGGGGGGSTEYRLENIPARALILRAYGIQQAAALIGGPAWLESERFDIVGKMPRPDSPRLAMLRTLLADRFKLVTHKESRRLPIYALVVARSDGRLGSKLHPSTCVEGRQPDGTLCMRRPGTGSFVGMGVPIAMLIDASLSSEVQRTVVDQTGLTGTFDIDLHWLPDGAGAATGREPAVSIFTAVQEQLGLKLEPTTGPVDVLVIDRVERPTEN